MDAWTPHLRKTEKENGGKEIIIIIRIIRIIGKNIIAKGKWTCPLHLPQGSVYLQIDFSPSSSS